MHAHFIAHDGRYGRTQTTCPGRMADWTRLGMNRIIDCLFRSVLEKLKRGQCVIEAHNDMVLQLTCSTIDIPSKRSVEYSFVLVHSFRTAIR